MVNVADDHPFLVIHLRVNTRLSLELPSPFNSAKSTTSPARHAEEAEGSLGKPDRVSN